MDKSLLIEPSGLCFNVEPISPTRRNYIDINWGAGKKKLTPEEKADLPVHLQDPD
jgi:hypothetical protein